MTEPQAVVDVGSVPARVIGVALAVAEPFGSQLQECRERFGDPMARLIPTHVTLLAPITVDESLLPEIEEHLRRVAEAERPFEIELRGTGTFRPVSPVVFVQLARGISGCERLERGIRSGPLARELAFPYHPHVTVAHDVPGAALDQAYAELSDYWAEFPAWGFSLYEHVGGVWRPQRDFPLGQELPGPVLATPSGD
ncbi:MAG TPA: 2'-5' RNA ligase family protein [Candidatus Limnocylindria bacterium]|nr:2'-5' RNA ligase family protein [Candidatus Limnocylindria bacterium]